MSIFVALGIAWGALLARPLVVAGRAVDASARAVALVAPGPGTGREPGPTRLGLVTRRVLGPIGRGPVGRVVGGLTRARRRRRGSPVERELPVAVDLLGVAVGAGCTPYLAVEVASIWAGEAVARHLSSVLTSCSLGMPFDAALDAQAAAEPLLAPVAEALLASDRLGAPVGPVLARLADEQRAGLRRRAEAHARRVPVRLLFPLVFLVLPAFVLLTVVPGLAAGLARL